MTDMLAERVDLVGFRARFADFLDERMLRGEGEERDAVNRDLRPHRRHVKAELETFAASDPVFLHDFDAFRPALEELEVFEELVGVVRDLQEPLRQFFLFDRRITAPAFAVNNLLVRENRAAGIAPVDGCFFLVGKAAFVKELEQPLRPFIIVRAARDRLAVPIIRKSHAALLAFHVLDVAERPVRRFDAVFDRRVFRRHTERVKSHRVQDVESLHRLVTRHDVTDRVIADMTHMQIARRIREHFECIILRTVRVHLRLINVLRLPFVLPFLFNFLRFITIQEKLPLYYRKPRLQNAGGVSSNSRFTANVYYTVSVSKTSTVSSHRSTQFRSFECFIVNFSAAAPESGC